MCAAAGQFVNSSAVSSSLSSSSHCQTPLSDADFYSADDDELQMGHIPSSVSALDETSMRACLPGNCENIPLLERITRTHPVWYLPNVTQRDVEIYLAKYEPGVFLVRQSLEDSTLILSVHLNEVRGISHHVIETTTRGLQLRGSAFSFSAITLLITHYFHKRIDFPIVLTLPKVLMECKNSLELNSFAMQGLEFWRSTSGTNSRKTPDKALDNFRNNTESLFNAMNSASLNAECDYSAIERHRILQSNENQMSSFATAEYSDYYDNSSVCMKQVLSPTNFYYSTSLEERLSDYEDIWTSPPPNETLSSCKKEISKYFCKSNSSSDVLISRNSEGCSNNSKLLTVPYSVTCHVINKPVNHTVVPTTISNAPLLDGFSSGRDSLTDSSGSTTVFQEKSEGYSSCSLSGCQESSQQPVKHEVQRHKSKGQMDVTQQTNCKLQNVCRHSMTKEDKISRPLSGQGLLMGRVGEIFSFEIDLENLVPRASQSSSTCMSSPQYMEPYESPNKDKVTNKVNGASRKSQTKSKCDKKAVIPASRFVPQTTERVNLLPLSLALGDRKINSGKNSSNSCLRDSVTMDVDYQEPFDSLRKERVSKPSARQQRISKKPGERVASLVAESADVQLLKSAVCVQKTCDNRDKTQEAALSLDSENLSQLDPCMQNGQGVKLRKNSQIKQQSQINNSNTKSISKCKTKNESKVCSKILNDTKIGETNSTISDVDDNMQTLPKFPFRERTASMSSEESCSTEELLLAVAPDATLKALSPLTLTNLQRMSAYDNVCGVSSLQLSPGSRYADSHTGTVYCEPWDARPWYPLFNGKENVRNSKCETVTSGHRTQSELNLLAPVNSHSLFKAAKEHQESTLAKSRASSTYLTSRKVFDVNHPSGKVHQFITSISNDSSTTFGATVTHFIRCTKEGQETNPFIVLRNVRQFMSGIKNYLLQHGELDFVRTLETERSRLSCNEFVNMDLLLEQSLHRCVIKPLKRHLFSLMLHEWNRNGSLKQIADNINYARLRTPDEIGLQMSAISPGQSLDTVIEFLTRMKRSYSPLCKMEHLLAATAAIEDLIADKSATLDDDKKEDSFTVQTMVARTEDVLPVFVNALIQMGYVTAELECDYIWGLLHSSLLTGETGYQLTTFSSAVLVLKNLHKLPVDYDGVKMLTSAGMLCGVLKVLVPDERSDSINTHLIPVRQSFTAKDICMMLANRLKVANPSDYELSVLIDGQETSLSPTAKPCQVIESSANKEAMFIFKRINARFLWPLGL